MFMKKLSFWGLIAAVLLIFSPVAMSREPGTLVVVQDAEPVGLDLMRSSLQATMNVNYNLHDTLLHPQDDGSVIPAIAESWERIDDRNWRFRLRRGATFHNGEPINAEAVKFSFDRLMNPEFRSPHRGKLFGFREVRVVDPHTVIFTTTEPFAPALHMLAYYLPIVPPGHIQKVGDTEYNMRPVGSGPYRLVRWVRGEEIVMERFEEYYGPKPAYRRLVFRAIPEEVSRIASLLTGEADVVSGISVHQRKRIEDSGRAYLTPQMGVMVYMGINTYEAPFNDVRVRQALNLSINRPLINRTLFGGRAIICNGPISPRTFGANPNLKPYPFDPTRSRELLRAAGHPGGLKVRLAYPTHMTQIQEQAEALAADLARGGFEVTLEPFERAVMWERYVARRHQLFLYWWDDAPEPHRYVNTLFHSKSRDYYYKNPKIDELLDRGAATLDPARRVLIYHEIDKILYDEAAWGFLYVIPEVFAVANHVNYQGRRDGFLNMRFATPQKR
jgi:peptide/nickel transport system substrate-binding protein